MKEQFRYKKFGKQIKNMLDKFAKQKCIGDTHELLDHIDAILNEHQEHGTTITIRQLYYDLRGYYTANTTR